MSAIDLRTMTVADLPLGMRLTVQAGWNQTEADWRRFLAMEPDGCFVAAAGGQPVATATACTFGAVGWIAAVLVDEAFRRRGIATVLVRRCLDYLQQRGIRTIRLDATPLGREVYHRLGFVAEYELLRMAGQGRAGASPQDVRSAGSEDLGAVVALDRHITGTDRAKLIEGLFRQQPDSLRVVGNRVALAGYLMFREGSRATQIGPGVAASPQVGSMLGDAMLARCAGRPVFVDVPTDNAPAIEWARRAGLRVQRPFTRMRHGTAAFRDHPSRIWASSGPEHG